MKTWIFVSILLLIIGTIAVFTYTGMFAQGSKIFGRECNPNWILLSEFLPNEEYCKTYCYSAYKITSYKSELQYVNDCSCFWSHNISKTSTWTKNKSECNLTFCQEFYGKNVKILKSWAEATIFKDYYECWCEYSYVISYRIGMIESEEKCFDECKNLTGDRFISGENAEFVNATFKKIPTYTNCYCDINNCNPK